MYDIVFLECKSTENGLGRNREIIHATFSNLEWSFVLRLSKNWEAILVYLKWKSQNKGDNIIKRTTDDEIIINTFSSTCFE